MNKFCRIFLILIIALPIFSLESCTDDSGLGANPFKVDLATINPIDTINGLYYLTLNDGTTLWPSSSTVKYKPKNNQRVFLNYTILGNSNNTYNYDIQVNSISNILTKQVEIETSENNSKFGNDPINIITLGIGDGYLNIRFGIMISGGQTKHALSLVTKDTKQVNDTITLELRHNAYNDAPNYEEKSYAAFDLKSLLNSRNDTIYLKLKTKDYKNKLQEFILQYKHEEKK